MSYWKVILNQRANRIRVLALGKLGSKIQHMNPVHSLIQNYFEVWHCGDTSSPALSSPRVKLNLLLQSQHTNPVSSLIQNCCAKLLCCDTSCPAISSPDVKWISCYNPNTRILFALWFKITFQYDIVVILHVLPFQVQMSNESLVTIPTHKSCSLFDSKLLCSMTLWWYFKSCTFKPRC